MSDACSTHETDVKRLQNSSLKSEGKIPFGRITYGRKNITKTDLRSQVSRTDGLCWISMAHESDQWWVPITTQRHRNSRPADRNFSSKEGLRWVKSVSQPRSAHFCTNRHDAALPGLLFCCLDFYNFRNSACAWYGGQNDFSSYCIDRMGGEGDSSHAWS